MNKEEADKIRSAAKIDFNIILSLTEIEARALEVLPSYGTKPFLEFFYKHLGKSYLEPHEKGLASLFETIKKELPKHLKKADDARKIFNQSQNKTIP